MKIFGLTGGIASGKSTVASILTKAGTAVIDADGLAREVVEKGSEGLGAIVEAFGPDVLDSAGNLDRKKVGALVFGNDKARRRLESLTHPRIAHLAAQRFSELAEAGHALVVYDVPLLFENNLDAMMNGTLLVACAEDLQVSRIMARDALDEAAARARIAAQMPLAQKRARATVILENEGPLEDLPQKVAQAWLRLTGEILSEDGT